ncbi:hypothetical protein GGX14DRAFT_408543 [Mycena pura]|uniref:Uncharacterized protein n=1 Tax=Mycena pura TaxID=153505 RepID=A0AAD6ULK4_9AGAR|nr:hypothetical protein GGX14DRAFT_408543 [Mycena pura]
MLVAPSKNLTISETEIRIPLRVKDLILKKDLSSSRPIAWLYRVRQQSPASARLNQKSGPASLRVSRRVVEFTAIKCHRKKKPRVEGSERDPKVADRRRTGGEMAMTIEATAPKWPTKGSQIVYQAVPGHKAAEFIFISVVVFAVDVEGDGERTRSLPVCFGRAHRRLSLAAQAPATFGDRDALASPRKAGSQLSSHDHFPTYPAFFFYLRGLSRPPSHPHRRTPAPTSDDRDHDAPATRLRVALAFCTQASSCLSCIFSQTRLAIALGVAAHCSDGLLQTAARDKLWTVKTEVRERRASSL